MSQASDATVTSLSIAETGLDAFFSDSFTIRPQPGDSFRYNVVDGYAWVVPEELQRPADTVFNDVVYSVRSTGYLIEPTLGPTPIGVRTMVQFARWQIGSIQTQAMYTGAAGIYRRGGLGKGQFRLEATPGGPDHLCVGAGPSFPWTRTLGAPGPADFVSGSGPITGAASSDSVVAAQTGIQWSSIVAGGFEADYNAVQLGDTSGFTSQLHVGNLTLSPGDRGSGLLIVTGDLITAGGAATPVEWRGIVLVGGMLRANAERTNFHGTVVTGLNAALGANVADDSVAGDVGWDKEANFYYEPCLIDSALTNLTGMIPVSRSRVDNWATY